MYQRHRLLLAAVVLFWSTACSSAATALKARDRIVFLGDSITEQRLYTRYVEQYLLCRYPDLKLTFFNAGWGGDTAPGGLQRLARDVFPLNPTIVTICFGMNDGGYRPFDEDLQTRYRDNMTAIVKALQEKGIRVIVLSPGCMDYDACTFLSGDKLRDADYNGTLGKFTDADKQIADTLHCEFVDLHNPMLDFLTAQKKLNPKFSFTFDGIHPTPQGHYVMATPILKALAEPLKPLGTVDINSSETTGSVKVDSKENKGINLTVQCPTQFSIPEDSIAIAQACGFVEIVSPHLIVTGLPHGSYTVTVNGKDVATASNSEVAAGVAIPVIAPTGTALTEVFTVKDANYFAAWRNVRLKGDDQPALQQAYEQMLAADTALGNAAQKLVEAPPTSVQVIISASSDENNLALHKPVACSDPNTYNAWDASQLTDGSWENTDKHCFATNPTDSFPKTATVDLGSVQTVASATFGVPPFGATKTIQFSISEDGVKYTDEGQHVFTVGQAEKTTIHFDPAKARYVRLTYPDHSDNGFGFPPLFVFTTELEVFGPATADH